MGALLHGTARRGTRSRHKRDRFSPCRPARDFGRLAVATIALETPYHHACLASYQLPTSTTNLPHPAAKIDKAQIFDTKMLEIV